MQFILTLIFLSILLIPIWKGRKQPLIPTFVFLGISTIVLIAQFAWNDTIEGYESRTQILLFAFMFLALGLFYLFKVISNKK
jgi:hypothetical protein